jgi:aspartyl aminopeptidase
VPEPLDDARDAISFIDASPSPYHAAAEVARRLARAGFVEVAERDAWPSEAGGHFLRRGGSVVAWQDQAGTVPRAFHIVGAHTDSPNLRVKPRPDISSAGWRQLGVEIYGGALLNSWLDRDLGLSGRVGLLGPTGPEVRLFRDDRPILRVPQLAIHLDREINQAGLKLNPQHHLTPTWGLGTNEVGGFVRYLASQIEADLGSIVSWDVMAHDITPGAIAGLDQELLSSARLDDLLSCWAATAAITSATAGDAGARDRAMPVMVLFDHEEVGSASSSGAAGDLLATTLERVVRATGGDGDDLARALAGSRLVSTDGAHATHPNYPERHDPAHLVSLNGGPVIKHNANARYATDAATAAWFERACREAEVPVQHFVSRNDMPCGSTIGPIAATRLGVATVDVGAAQVAMHSARELCGAHDPQLLRLALTACLHS